MAIKYEMAPLSGKLKQDFQDRAGKRRWVGEGIQLVKTIFYCRIKWNVCKQRANDLHCKRKETLFIQNLNTAFNENVGSEKLLLY